MGRFIARQAGRMVVGGATNFAVDDTMPEVGSDGRVGDFATMAAAEECANALNCAFAADSTNHVGRVWRAIPGRSFAFAWLTPAPIAPTCSID